MTISEFLFSVPGLYVLTALAFTVMTDAAMWTLTRRSGIPAELRTKIDMLYDKLAMPSKLGA